MPENLTVKSKTVMIMMSAIPAVVLVSSIVFTWIYHDFIILRQVQAGKLAISKPLIDRLGSAAAKSFDPKEQYEVLDILLREKQYEKASVILGSMIADNSTETLNRQKLLLMLSRNSANAGWYEKASAQFERYLKENPENYGVRAELAGVLLKTGRKDTAIAQYQQLIKHAPENIKWYELLADAAGSEVMGNKAEDKYFYIAEQALENALELKQEREIYKKLAKVLSWQNKHQKALDMVRKCMPFDIGETKLCMVLALAVGNNAECERKDIELITAIAKQALAEDEDVELLISLARAMRKLEYNELAIGLFERFIKLKPNDQMVRYEMANFLHNIGRYRQAETYYTDLLEETANIK